MKRTPTKEEGNPNKIPEAHLEEDKLSPGEESGDQSPDAGTNQRDLPKKRVVVSR